MLCFDTVYSLLTEDILFKMLSFNPLAFLMLLFILSLLLVSYDEPFLFRCVSVSLSWKLALGTAVPRILFTLSLVRPSPEPALLWWTLLFQGLALCCTLFTVTGSWRLSFPTVNHLTASQSWAVSVNHFEMFPISTVISLELPMHRFSFWEECRGAILYYWIKKILCSQKYSLEYFEIFCLLMFVQLL